ncbi:hypothetical protein ACTTBA_14725 [Shewanella frigidimarina]|uniref:hypothetical protein n=1 Tax=Shewanella frigidimarina TaxID=56812 RepID=UPI003FA17C2E
MVNKRRKRISKQPIRQVAVDELTARARIISALNNEKYIARTVNGIATEAKLPVTEVVKVLTKDTTLRPEMKVLARKTLEGKVLLTTKNHFTENASFRDKFIDVFATKRVSFDDIK